MKLTRLLSLSIALGCGGAAYADRVPVAVLWLGDATTLEDGARIANEVNASLSRAKSARPLDSVEDKRLLVEGGAVTRAAAMVARAEALFVKMKLGDAVKEYEAAEQVLLTEVPIAVTQRRLGEVERNLLVCYDQLGRRADAARAAERLTWTAGTNDDVKVLLERHLASRAYQPAYAPVKIETTPPGAQVYRNLQPVGVTPIELPGGDPSVDMLDVDLSGFRRAHAELPRVGSIQIALQTDDRLGALVDQVRAKAPEPPAAELAALAKRVGAGRILGLSPDGAGKLSARWVETATQTWAPAAIRVDAAGQPAMDRLAGYVSPQVTVPSPRAAAMAAGLRAAGPPPVKAKSKWGAWGKWYTWVAAGGVVILVGGLIIAKQVGDDSLKIAVTH